MADPATIAMAAKTAIALATDKNTWKVIGVIIGAAVALILLPLLLIMSLLGGGAEQNKSTAEIVFKGGAIPSSYSAEYRDYVVKMQEAFAKIDAEITTKNAELTESGLDDIRIKAVFYSLYFGQDFSNLDDQFFIDFVAAFTETNGADHKPIADLNIIYSNLSTLIGREITETEKANINNLYSQMKYGYIASGTNSAIPGEALGDETFAALMAEATKYIGYPYVWGGSSPSESFDCSGFICWSYTQSGVFSLPRTTAQGIYNQCALVSKEDVKPGDLVFFTKTYKSTNPVTHVGIYIGDGKVLDAGDPIGIHDLNGSWYKQHFYGYGRLLTN